MNRFTPIARFSGEAGLAPGERRYWAFLSYAHADSRAAGRLHSELERFRVPAALVGKPHPLGTIPPRLTPIFRDRQELAAASNLGREIAEALEKSHYFVVLCSPAAAQSKWVEQEIREFQRLHGPERILAAILDGEPGCGEDGRECFPPALREQGSEPIAADLRASGDGWRGGFLKIVAGMLDVGLDELVQRDQQRRQKRMAWIAAASFVGMASTSGLAVFALEQRDSAREERRQAEGLVEFMLGDLKAKLEPIGKLDALDGVGSKILEYYSRQDAAALDEAGLLQRSRALSLTAQVAYQRADRQEAERLYRQAMAGTAETIRRKPGDAQLLFDHAQNVFWIGEIARFDGRLEDAEAAYREYHQLAERMVAIDPANLKWRMEKVYAAENLAIVLLNRRRFTEAGRRIEAALGPMSAMARANPENLEYQREMSTVLAWMADARRDEGRLKEATALRRRQLAFIASMLNRGISDVKLREQVVWAHQALGLLLASQGEREQSIAALKAAVDEADRLNRLEPQNARWRGAAARARLELASALIDFKQPGEAGREAAVGCGLSEALREQSPSGSAWRDLQTSCRINRAKLALQSGSFAEAIVHAEQAIESARGEASADPLRPRYSIAAAYRVMGDGRLRSGDRAGAEQAWKAGLSQLPGNVAERPREMHERMQLLTRLGRRNAAAPLAERLEKTGFKASI